MIGFIAMKEEKAVFVHDKNVVEELTDESELIGRTYIGHKADVKISTYLSDGRLKARIVTIFREKGEKEISIETLTKVKIIQESHQVAISLYEARQLGIHIWNSYLRREGKKFNDIWEDGLKKLNINTKQRTNES